MPNCSICGQPIDKLPHWLDDVDIAFRCAVCAEATAHHPVEPVEEDEVKDPTAPAEFEVEEEEEEEDETEE